MLQSVLGYIDGKITGELTGAGLAIYHFTVFYGNDRYFREVLYCLAQAAIRMM